MRVSVVINTYNRALSLRETLCALRQQTHDAFEVVVVYGPCTDNTEAVLAEFAADLHAVFCPEVNISKSRNLGIARATGEVVAFIDDDAVPDPHWLAELVAGYDSEKIGGVGGVVYDHTGYSFQQCPLVCDRRGSPRFDVQPPLWAYLLPQGDAFVHLLGTNASFRRKCLLEIGGFDEEIEYFLDETDVCMRVIDCGYWLRLVSGAAVYHRFLPSHLRNQHKVLRNPFPVVKNRFYFALQAARTNDSVPEILKDCQEFADRLVQEAGWHQSVGLLSPAELATFEEDVRHAAEVGTNRGLSCRRRSVVIPPPEAADFRRFPTVRPRSRRLTICFVSQEIPPENYGGIGRFTHDLALGFAAQGHEVHLLTRSPDHNRVDLENGLWVHRLESDTDGPWNSPELAPVVRKNLGRAAAVHREVMRIGRSRHIDLVSVPIWDSEGYFCLLDESLTCVLTLQTTLKIFSELNQSLLSPAEWDQVLALERATVRAAQYVHSISRSILERVRRDYAAPAEPAEARVIPLGIADRAGAYRRRAADDRLRVLFVGRLEKRKGVDLLLEAAAVLTQEYPHVEFVLVGDDTIPAEGGLTYRAAFEQHYGGHPAQQRVFFKGLVPEAELYQYYADCDIFCLPARYESFGLVFLEAMMFGKPVVGCASGGMVEVIANGVNGFLGFTDDAQSLTAYLRRLIENESLRREFGRQSRLRYETLFSAEKMVADTLRAYTDIIERSGKGDGTSIHKVTANSRSQTGVWEREFVPLAGAAAEYRRCA
jgi:glycosyltransferase involved in cell wall biosynthesis